MIDKIDKKILKESLLSRGAWIEIKAAERKMFDSAGRSSHEERGLK